MAYKYFNNPHLCQLTFSGELDASAAIKASTGVLSGIIVTTDGTNNATVTLYDNASAGSGTKIIPTIVVPASDRFAVIPVPIGVAEFTNGCYLSLSGTGAKAEVYFR